MADKIIRRKELIPKFKNITRQDWKRAALKLQLIFDCSHGKGSHCVIRNPKYPDAADIRGLISTVQKNLYEEANKRIFKNLVAHGIAEDNVWSALGFL